MSEDGKNKKKKRNKTLLCTSKLMSHTIHVWSAELVATTLSSVPLHSMLVMGARWNWKCATGLSFSNFLKSQILKLLNNEKTKKEEGRRKKEEEEGRRKSVRAFNTTTTTSKRVSVSHLPSSLPLANKNPTNGFQLITFTSWECA